MSEYLELITDLLDLDIDPSPETIAFITFCFLIGTLVFIILFRRTISSLYGKQAYWWYLILLVSNLINIGLSVSYYSLQNGEYIGEPGHKGRKGLPGDIGDVKVCGYCEKTGQIGLTYSNSYINISQLNKTTNITGNISFWSVSHGIPGFTSIGDVVFQKDTHSKIKSYMIGNGGKLLEPDDFHEIVTLNDGKHYLTFWRAEPPTGYIALGDVCQKNENSGTKTRPPNRYQICIKKECLQEHSIPKLIHVASYPEIEKLEDDGVSIRFCSFWQTPLNTFYCYYPSPDKNWSNNTLWYNIVEGNPEYVSNKGKPVREKLNHFTEFLKSKTSIIPRDSEEILGITVNSHFIEPTTNSNGKIIKYTFISREFEKDVQDLDDKKFFEYLLQIINVLELLSKKDYPIDFIGINQVSDQKIKIEVELLQKLFDDPEKINQEEINQTKQLVSALITNPNLTRNINQLYDTLISKKNQSSTGGNNKIYTVISNINKMNHNDLSKLLKELNKSGVLINNDLVDFMGSGTDIFGNNLYDYGSFQDQEKLPHQAEINSVQQNSNQKIKTSEKRVKKIYEDYTLYDDLNYLFPSSYNEQIAINSEGLLYGGYLITENKPNAIQKKNFINYLKTFLKPNYKTYSFKDKCLMFSNNDPERNSIIQQIKEIYYNVDRQTASINLFQNCDNDSEIIRYYQNMIRSMDRQFKFIDNYTQKLANQEFHYFSTGRLKWLQKQLAGYLETIQKKCTSDQRKKIVSQIRLLIQQTYQNQCFPNFKTPEWENKFKDINNYYDKIVQNDFYQFTIPELKSIRNELRNAKINNC